MKGYIGEIGINKDAQFADLVAILKTIHVKQKLKTAALITMTGTVTRNEPFYTAECMHTKK